MKTSFIHLFLPMFAAFLLFGCAPAASKLSPTLPSEPTFTAESIEPTLTARPAIPQMRPVGTFGVGVFSGVFRSPDGKRIFALMNGKELRWYDAKTLQQEGLMTLSDYPFHPSEVIFGPDPNIVAVVGFYAPVVDLKNQKVIATVSLGAAEAYLYGLQFSLDAKLLFFHRVDIYNHGQGHSIHAWDIQQNQQVHSYWQPDDFTSITDPAISPNGKWIAAGYDNLLQIRDVQTEEMLQSFKGHDSNITSVAFSKDGSRLASVDIDGGVRLWDSRTGQDLGKFFLELETQVVKLSFSEDDQELMATCDDRSQQVIDLQTGRVQGPLMPMIDPFAMMLHHQGYSQFGYGGVALAISPDGKTLAVGSGTVLLWDIQTQKLLGVLENPGNDYLVEIRFDPTGHILVGNTGPKVLVWNVTATTQPNLAKALGPASKIWHDGLSFSADGKRLAFGNGIDVEIWDIETAQHVKTLKIGSEVQSTQLSENGQFLYASGAHFIDENRNWHKNIQIWNIEKSRLMQWIDIPSMDVESTLALDYPFVALHIHNSSIDSRKSWVEVWNLETKSLKKIDTGYYRSVIFNKNRDLLFTNDDVNTSQGKFYVWKVDTGKRVYSSEGTNLEYSFYDIDLLQTSNFVATHGYQDGIVRLFDISAIIEAVRQP